jgi:type 1 glutamine amidotransferase
MRNLILTGGPYHSFAETSKLISELLALDGIESEITDDVEEGLASAPGFDLLTLNLLRWRMLGDFFDEDRAEWAMTLSSSGRQAFHEHLARGRGILALHTASICFDDWPEWDEIIGAHWDWERSSHPPPRSSAIRVATGVHPIVADATDFEVVDEIYSYLACRDVSPLMTSARRGEQQPLLWARSVGGGRVAYDALGHDERSISEPTHATIIRRAAAWASGRE